MHKAIIDAHRNFWHHAKASTKGHFGLVVVPSVFHTNVSFLIIPPQRMTFFLPPLNLRSTKCIPSRLEEATDAAVSDGAGLRESLLNKTNTASSFWADTAYRSKANEGLMEKQGFVSKIHRKKPHLKPMPRHIQRPNGGKSVIRSRIEHVFADQKSLTGLFVITVSIARATIRIGLANIVCNMRSFLLLGRINAAT